MLKLSCIFVNWSGLPSGNGTVAEATALVEATKNKIKTENVFKVFPRSPGGVEGPLLRLGGLLMAIRLDPSWKPLRILACSVGSWHTHSHLAVTGPIEQKPTSMPKKILRSILFFRRKKTFRHKILVRNFYFIHFLKDVFFTHKLQVFFNAGDCEAKNAQKCNSREGRSLISRSNRQKLWPKRNNKKWPKIN